MKTDDNMENIVSLAKRRGFVYPGSEIYGGLGGIYDLGPYGVELANNIKRAWWQNIVQERDNVVGLDSAILMNQQVWQTSGHIESFTDPLVECKNCHSRFRQDTLPTKGTCPTCGKKDWTPPRQFNLMFKTHIGPAQDTSSVTYLRPETAQGIFVNFGNVLDSARVKLPFGIAQIGKGFRNEITTGNFLFRVREFEMMELEYFTFPAQAEKDFEYWQKERLKWFTDFGIKKTSLRFREHKQTERAHYATHSVDIEYHWPFMGWGELEGIANRTDYDLKAHAKASGKELSYFDEKTGKKIVPHVIEPSLGVGRAMLAFMLEAYTEEKAPTAGGTGEEERVVMKLHPALAPVKVAILPLVNKDKLPAIAKEIYDELKQYWMVEYDDSGSIGRRYRRQDEIGTPFAITVDFDTLKDQTVTVRDRDSMKQERVKIKELKEYLDKKLR